MRILIVVLLVMFLVLTMGCAMRGTMTPPPRSIDTQWSDSVHQLMLECGKLSVKLVDDPRFQDILYGRCLRDMGATL